MEPGWETGAGRARCRQHRWSPPTRPAWSGASTARSTRRWPRLRCCSRGCGARAPARERGLLRLPRLRVPIEDLLAVPVQHAFEFGDALVHLLKVLDAERLAADVGVDGDRHYLG